MNSNPNTYYCKVSGQPIPPERVEALRLLEIPESEWTLKEFSTARKKQGMWMGEVGGSELKIVRKVDQQTLRQVFSSRSCSDEEVASEIEQLRPESED